MKVSDVLMIGAVLAGPVLAVQAQKWIERFNERQKRKMDSFYALMATRGSRLSQEHVTALNRIDLVFYGSLFLGYRFQTPEEKAVTAAWNEYLDSLTVNFNVENWQARDELFVNLLSAMAKCLRLDFDRVHLKRNVYSPLGHIEVEQELHKVRKAVLEIVEGRRSLKVEPTQSSQQHTLPNQ